MKINYAKVGEFTNMTSAFMTENIKDYRIAIAHDQKRLLLNGHDNHNVLLLFDNNESIDLLLKQLKDLRKMDKKRDLLLLTSNSCGPV